ncbi:MAG TPA: hypothetical protein VJ962_06040 [Clostridia bacterium]|nr:hypothetical protein [Clostridia bacterium]
MNKKEYKGYKGNRPSSYDLELRWLKSRVKVLKEKYARYKRVNKRKIDKGLEPKYKKEDFKDIERQIFLWKVKIDKQEHSRYD